MFTWQGRLAAGLATLLASTAAPAGEATFQADIQPLTEVARERMQGVSFAPGCPVGPDDLVAVRLAYWGFDGVAQRGVLVIHRTLASETVAIFRELFEARFPIRRMQPYEDFAPGAYAEHDDTAGFYCRPDQGDPSKFGMHSYGYAIDLNPMENPYHDPRKGWWPPGSGANAGRAPAGPGAITSTSAAFAIFTRHGWLWGGLFRDDPDYMHFEKATIGAHPDPTRAPYLVDGLRFQGSAK